jgi:hypothetical protein
VCASFVTQVVKQKDKVYLMVYLHMVMIRMLQVRMLHNQACSTEFLVYLSDVMAHSQAATSTVAWSTGPSQKSKPKPKSFFKVAQDRSRSRRSAGMISARLRIAYPCRAAHHNNADARWIRPERIEPRIGSHKHCSRPWKLRSDDARRSNEVDEERRRLSVLMGGS